MCGFLGLVNHRGVLSEDEFNNVLQVIRHRGPDSQSIFDLGNTYARLGFVRLSIIDIDGGTQPIYNETKSVAVILNGEIYNYVELAEELKQQGYVFTTNSDTEVLVHLYEEYGINMISKLRGMFAFALWDDVKQELYLVRDRIGIKPLYYTSNNGMFGFGSEIKPLLRFPFVTKELSERGINLFLNYGYIIAPDTIFKDIKKLEAGHYLLIKKDQIIDTEYWDCRNPEQNLEAVGDIEEKVIQLFKESIRMHMRSDVPIGVYLSGGIDSGLIAAFAAQEAGKISTYTIRFEDAEFDESYMAAKVAEKYHTEHHCYTVSNKQMMELFPKMMWVFDEPLGDSGILPNYLINELVAKDGIKVVLSGAGGDELFAGYLYYFENEREKKLRKLAPLVKIAAKITKKSSPELSGKLIRSIIYDSDRYEHYNGHKIVWGNEELQNLLNLNDRTVKSTRKYFDEFNGEHLNKVLYTDLKTYLCDDLLYLTDRACMIHSVEGRVPFLDHRLVEYALSIPAEKKTLNGNRKGMLKQIAEQFLPAEMINLPKQGFNAPVNSWSNGEFGQLMIKVLRSDRCQNRVFWNEKYLNRYLGQKEVLGKAFHKTYLLFSLEMYLRIHVENDYDSVMAVDWKEAYE